jgi:putrescine aminotransferase
MGRKMLENSLIEQDRRHLIHSVVSWTGHEHRGASILHAADGVYVTDAKGHVLLDGFSGLWCVNAGYGRQSIVAAAQDQMSRLPYATGYFHFANEPAIRLAALLADRAPGDLSHVFFTQGGSDAVDTALRLIRYFFNVTGRPHKKHIISVDRGYHGSSAAGAGVTGLSAFHVNFDVPTTSQHHIATPYPYRSESRDAHELVAQSVRQFRDKVGEIGAENVAAFFAEPVVGSGGVIVPPDGWLAAIREACREFDILFVADEVITGFGRTGPLFGCEHDGVEPDIMTVAKGLTSGYCPMGAVLLSDAVYRAIADQTPVGLPVGHGMTYSGHPVSAAVGLEVMRLYEEEGILANGVRVGAHLGKKLEALGTHPLVGDVRARGMLAGIELVTDKHARTRPATALQLPDHLARIGYRNGLIFRAFADGIIGLAPPLCCTEAEIDLLAERLTATLDQVLEISEIRQAMA